MKKIAFNSGPGEKLSIAFNFIVILSFLELFLFVSTFYWRSKTQSEFLSIHYNLLISTFRCSSKMLSRLKFYCYLQRRRIIDDSWTSISDILRNMKSSQSLTIFVFLFASISWRVICKKILNGLMEQNIWTSKEYSSIMRLVFCMQCT